VLHGFKLPCLKLGNVMTSNLLRITRFCVFVLAIAMAASGYSYARGKFSAVTVDARTGEVLFSNDLDGQRHPASLTKMMTLYILFQELKSGRVELNSTFRVSRRAASMAPSKMGLRAGQTISVENAIKALVIKSANDVAATIGENLEGTEGAFATRMTQVARSIGMSHTTYRNASGLPNPGQITTARDQATLGLRLMRDFPQYYPYFRATSFTYNGRTIRTHNRLVGRFPGTDGIKTGYINASGYNLVTSTRRGDKRLVGVVMGGRTAGARNSFMVTMLTKMFNRAKSGNTIAAVAGSSRGAINPIAVATSKTQPVVTPSAAEQDNEKLAEVAAAVAVEDTASDAGDEDGAGKTEVLEAKLDDRAPEKVPFQVKSGEDNLVTGSTSAEWSIQVGSFSRKISARKLIAQLRDKNIMGLKSKLAQTEAAEAGKKVIYRARFEGFNQLAAQQTCQGLIQRGQTCVVLAP
jgi:D-alanyl-D-alanine carboxypeptidase